MPTYTTPGIGQCELVLKALIIFLPGIWKSIKSKQHLSGTGARAVDEIKL